MTDLPGHVLRAMHGAGVGGLTAVVATVGRDGAPHTAPFGSICAVSPTALRFGCDRRHDTFANLDGHPEVVVCLLVPPDVAVSIFGRASVIKLAMSAAETDAVVEIVVEQVKDDMLPGASIQTGITYAVSAELASFIAAYAAEVAGAGG